MEIEFLVTQEHFAVNGSFQVGDNGLEGGCALASVRQSELADGVVVCQVIGKNIFASEGEIMRIDGQQLACLQEQRLGERV